MDAIHTIQDLRVALPLRSDVVLALLLRSLELPHHLLFHEARHHELLARGFRVGNADHDVASGPAGNASISKEQ